MILFWAVFDGIMTYVTPLVITEAGLSKTLMGIIVGTSSIAGALFDFLICRFFKNTYYRRIFFLMFAVCFIYPLILFTAKSFLLYMIAMALWGFYYDLKNFGNFDFVGKYTSKTEHSSSFGVIQVFSSIGYLLAPIICGAVIGEVVDWKPFIMGWVFLLISIMFFLILFFVSKREREEVPHTHDCSCKKTNFFEEFSLWKKIGKSIFPILLLTLALNLVDAFFWTIGPLLAESIATIKQLAGLFMTAYSLPALLVGWIVGYFTIKYGKKMTAYVSFLIGSLLLSFLALFNNPILMILDIFLASIGISMAWPAINGVYADFISEKEKYEKEIEGLEDFYTNIGYIIGPIAAGFMADQLGNSLTFTCLGVFGVIVSLVLIKMTPRKLIITA